MKYKHIVFDVDGTLLDTAETSLRCLQRVFVEVLGVEYPMEELRPLFGIPCAEIAEMYKCPDVEYNVKTWQRYDHEAKSSVQLFPGIREVLDKLYDTDYVLGVVTSRSRPEVEQQMPMFQLDKYFETSICSDDTARRKPFPDPLLKYLELTGAGADEVLYIGDSKHDMECAKAAGIDGALAGWGSMTLDLKEAAYVFEKPENVLAFLEV